MFSDGRLCLSRPESPCAPGELPIRGLLQGRVFLVFLLGMAWPQAMSRACFERAECGFLRSAKTKRAKSMWLITEETCTVSFLPPHRLVVSRVAARDCRDGRGFEVRSSRFSELRPPELWIAPVALGVPVSRLRGWRTFSASCKVRASLSANRSPCRLLP